MIQVNGLSKVYTNLRRRNTKAISNYVAGLKEITFHVRQGEVFGLLGPNGAGKTTVIRHLMGFIKPDSGYARINGLDCWEESKDVKALVGYLPGEMNFLREMTGHEFLNLMAGMHGNSPVFRKRRDALAERLDLNLKQSIKKMSKGMKQKLGIINTMMLDARVLILDEPTSGLDPLMQKEFIELVLEEKSRGKTILISSHMFPEVERTCDRVGIIRAGELAAVEGIQKLRQEQRRTFEITVETSEQAQRICESGLKVNLREADQVSVQIEGDLNPLLRALAQVQVKDFSQKMTELEEAFMVFYERGEGSE
ncbi:ABC-type multidrug transport system, ATPase component [Desulfosporosinus acidiphilus SJ4]|uniref:ABC-type multidrug transport system, ATPase component n=1 Tax=Desulfosporosinus acidiphilus (strain DSM 22704 / JCM 16185 / SJ4) TaxID=646529 RepID=I4D323_DESAJ|nr:ABC transporter ATP-binding protein [Desulfosporosinus acidiphilus]AFM40197.1 ABC-type multidrug transport system, ATPase component [Desulfosporosinus acidiphilus SJ4]